MQDVNNAPQGDQTPDLDLEALDVDFEPAAEASTDAPAAETESQDLALDYNPGDIPPELQAKWTEIDKGYKSAFTKKTQEIAALRKDLETRLAASYQNDQKSVMFDQVMSIPEVREVLQGMVGADGSVPGTQKVSEQTSGEPTSACRWTSSEARA